MNRMLLTLLLAAVAGTSASSVVFVAVSAAMGNTFGWLGALGLAALLGFWPALAISFGVGAPALALLHRLKAPLIVYPLTGLALTAALAIAGHYFFRSPTGASFLGLMFIGVQLFWLPCALTGGAAITAVISAVEQSRHHRTT